jgi:hypothetical protein
MRPINTGWKSTPGNFDPNHTMDPMQSDNELGIPEIAAIAESIHFDWTHTFDDYRTIVRQKRLLPDGLGLVNFFTEDYRFEQLWTSPSKFLTYMSALHWAATPDFSLYTDHPPAVHIWNIFRSRWLGAYWQRGGLQIIPTVSWATPESYDYCFLGLPKHSVLAVSTVGVLKDREARRLWVLGFDEMCIQLEPMQVICYGAFPPGYVTRVPHQILTPFSNTMSQRIGRAQLARV